MPPGTQVSFEEALSRVEAVRGLRKKAPVSGLLVAPSDLSAHLTRALAFERPEQVLKGTEQMLVGLGLTDPQFDFHSTMIALLEENLAGLYEPRLKLMMVRQDLPEETKQITLLHELVHALQDQYFDLDEIVTANPDDSDRSSALSCLAEGDATSAMLDGVLPDGKTALDLPEGSIEAQFFGQAPKTPAPDIIIRSLYAPYLDGLEFVHKLRKRGGFAEVNRAFLRPPESTEQILHLEKYDAHEPPRKVAVPPPPGPQYQLVLHDIWGEQSLRLALQEWTTSEAAEQAAAGWGGDRIVSYQKGKQLAVAWDVVMDSEAEAVELWSTLRSSRLVKAPSAQPSAEAGQPELMCVQSGATRPLVALARQGRHVVWASGPFDRQTGRSTCAEAEGWMQTLLANLTP